MLTSAIVAVVGVASIGRPSVVLASDDPPRVDYEPQRIEADLDRESREGVQALGAAYREVAKSGYDPSTKLVLLWRVGAMIHIEFRNRERARDGQARLRFDPRTGRIDQISIDG